MTVHVECYSGSRYAERPIAVQDVYKRQLLSAPHNPALLPAHFLKVTLARIGGRVLQFEVDGSIVGVCLLYTSFRDLRGLSDGSHPMGRCTLRRPIFLISFQHTSRCQISAVPYSAFTIHHSYVYLVPSS